jgi:hypothetical protein
MKAIKYIKLGKVQVGYGLGGNANLYVAVLGDKLGYLPNENTPYTPIGGIKTLVSVRDILIFK